MKPLKSTPPPPLSLTIVNRMERTCTTNRYTLSNCRPQRTIRQSVCLLLCRPGATWSVTCLHHRQIKWRCSHVSTRHHRLVRPGMGCMCESLCGALINLVQSQITSFLCMLLPKTKKRLDYSYLLIPHRPLMICSSIPLAISDCRKYIIR